jgi:glucose-1-phosphate adenylyltransferase
VDEQDSDRVHRESRDAPTIPGSPDVALGSMGIYIFDTDVLLKALEADAATASSHDFGKDIIRR